MRPLARNRHKHFSMPRRPQSDDLDVMSSNEQPMLPFLLLTKPKFKFSVPATKNVFIDKPIFSQIRSSTPEIKDNTVRTYSVCVKLCQQRGKSALLLNFSFRRHKRYVHEAEVRLCSLIPSSTPVHPPYNQAATAISSSSKPARMVNVSPHGIITDRRASILRTCRGMYSSALCRGGY